MTNVSSGALRMNECKRRTVLYVAAVKIKQWSKLACFFTQLYLHSNRTHGKYQTLNTATQTPPELMASSSSSSLTSTSAAAEVGKSINDLLWPSAHEKMTLQQVFKMHVIIQKKTHDILICWLFHSV